LLADAGWQIKDGVLRNAKGESLVLEYMDSSEGGVKMMSAWARNLEKLGITLKLRVVDFALYQQRMDKFDYDIVSLNIPGTNNPGQEYADLFGSAAADQESSGNFIGLKNPAVDAMIAQMAGAKTIDQLLPACHALERIIVAGHYLVPAWYAPSHRMVYDAWRLVPPSQTPAYTPGETWVIYNWWAQLSPRNAQTAKP
jgi:microcin C transport system substrate-binding protein